MVKIWNYGKKTKHNGYTFDSLKELDFYLRFCEKYDTNEHKDKLNNKFVVLVHPSYKIIDKVKLKSGTIIRSARYTPDVVITDRQGNLLHVYDVKNGFSSYAVDSASKLRFKLFTERYGVPVECVVVRKNDFKVKVFGTTKKTQEHVFRDFDYDWSEAL